jgi:hypothetical protein
MRSVSATPAASATAMATASLGLVHRPHQAQAHRRQYGADAECESSTHQKVLHIKKQKNKPTARFIVESACHQAFTISPPLGCNT